MNLEEAYEVVDTAIFSRKKRHLSEVESTIFKGAWKDRTYESIAKDSQGRYSINYLKRDVGPKFWRLLSEVIGEEVSKTNFRAALERQADYGQIQPSPVETHSDADKGSISSLIARETAADRPSTPPPSHRTKPLKDWGEAVDTDLFRGRQSELRQLSKWIVQDRCRLIALLGIGGIGKTLLAVKVAAEVQEDFQFVFWRSLQYTPSPNVILTQLIQFVSDSVEDLPENSPEDIDGKISQLMNLLRENRCLVVLDDFDVVLSPERVGSYSPGYEVYSKLLRRMAEERHQSCLVVTSREKPKEFSSREGKSLLVRSLSLPGLNTDDAKTILEETGLDGTKAEYEKLNQLYAGNPLNLKLAAIAIQDLFKNNTSEFLEQKTLVFDGIRSVLDKQFNRLPELERELIYWLAINCKPTTLQELQEDIVFSQPKRRLLEALQSLERRSMIESIDVEEAVRFTLQPVVREYITERLIEEICNKLEIGNNPSFDSHAHFNIYALMKAQADDPVRVQQMRCILEPLKNCLISLFSSEKKVEEHLSEMLSLLQEKYPLELGYAAGNIINLLAQVFKADLSGRNLSHLTLWQTNLQNVDLQGVKLNHCNLEKSVFNEILGYVLTLACSPDETLLAAGDANGRIHVWNLITNSKLLCWEAHTSWVRAVAFSPDGQIIASSSNDQTVKLWDVRTNQLLGSLPNCKDWVRSVAFSPQGRLLASGSDDSLTLWDWSTGEKQILSEDGHTDRVRSVAFSPDGRLLASGSDDCTVKLWDVVTGQCLNTLKEHENWVRSVAFLPMPDSNILASSSDDRTIRLWDFQIGECLSVLKEHKDRVRTIAFNPTGDKLISGSDDRTVKLWDVQARRCLTTLQGHESRVQAAAFMKQGTAIASGSDDQTLKFWHLGGECFKTFRGYIRGISAIAFTRDGQSLVSANHDRRVGLWDIKTEQCFQTLEGHTARVRAVAIHPDGFRIATAGDDQTIRLWHLVSGEQIQLFKRHRQWVRSIAFSPDGKVLASAGDDHTVRLWEVETGKYLQKFEQYDHWIRSIAFSSDGKILAGAGDAQFVQLWNVGTKASGKLAKHQHRIQSIAFSPNNQLLASGSDDHTVIFWRIDPENLTGEVHRVLEGHPNGVKTVAFSPDGTLLASGDHDGTIKLWEVDTGNCRQTLPKHDSQVRSVAFDPEGELLASSSQDGEIRLWHVQSGILQSSFRYPRPYENMDITGATGLTQAQKTALLALGAIDRDNLT